MAPQIPKRLNPDLVNLCLGILKNIIKVENPEGTLNRIVECNSNGRQGYKTSELDRISDACAFWLRDLNHVPYCGGKKIPFPDIARLLEYKSHSSVTSAIKRHIVYVDEVTQEDPQAQERAAYVDRVIKERRTRPLELETSDQVFDEIDKTLELVK